MATPRQREKPTKKSQKENASKVATRQTRYGGQRGTTSQNIKNEPVSEQSSTYMSLDVLAQVASDTLKKEPKLQPISEVNMFMPKKLTKRSIQSLEVLHLDHIQGLSDKALLSLFSELTANEMTKNYTYSCYLMPDKCQDKFTSFGNETRARLKMRTHLLSHIELLIDDANDPDIMHKFQFTAVPVHVRKRRIAESLANKGKKSGSVNKSGKGSSPNNKKTNFTALRPSSGNSLPPDKAKKANSPETRSKSHFSPDDLSSAGENEDTSLNNSSKSSPSKKNMAKRYAHKQAKLSSTAGHDSSSKQKSAESKSKTKHVSNPKTSKKSTKDASAQVNDSDSDNNSLHGETERRIEENEQFIIDLLSRTQPHHDHCYTTIFGKKRGIELMHFDLDSSCEEENDENGIIDVGDYSAYYGDEAIHPRKKVVPILLFRHVNRTDMHGEIPMVSAEEIIGDDEGHSGQKPYPPMPKSALAKKGRVDVPEENADFIEPEEENPVTSPAVKKRKKTPPQPPKEGSSEWERKMALKCIRELKFRKRDDKVGLVCRICKDKTFTASATLMYHYRSHAGIKPFVCLICNTTFTRQHSLNYHMLIHNNQSRFTCKDCGRKFRHPSHFKEHLRRHTGETPFECMDCPQKFKTRNTYKRHLKTRHGKLLTASGIHLLTKEEFLKVRTKPYKKPPSMNENASQTSYDDSDEDNSVASDHESHDLVPRMNNVQMPQVPDQPSSLFVPLSYALNAYA